MFTGSRSAPDWGELPCRVVQPPTRCAPSCFLSTNEKRCFRDRGQVGSRFIRHCLARDFHPKHAYTDWENRQAGLLASPHQSRWDRKVPGHSQEIFLQQQRERGAGWDNASTGHLLGPGKYWPGPQRDWQDWLQTSYWFLSPCIS